MFKDLILSFSLASSWAWGVSVVVGMEVFSQKGIEAFTIWAIANALALLLFGALTVHVAGKRMDDVLPIQIRPLYKFLGVVIQFFSVLVNLTALEMAARMIGLPEWFLLLFSVLLFAVVWTGGFPKAVAGSALQFVVFMILILLALGDDSHSSLTFSSRHYGWALWSAVILLSGPFLDQQIWQRRFVAQEKLRPFVWASIWFAFYMVLIGVLSYKDGGKEWIIGAIIMFVAGSTLMSAYSAIGSYGKTRLKAKAWMAGVVTMAFLALTLRSSVLDIWTFYGSLRIPFAIVVVGCLLFKYKARRKD